MGRTPRQRPLMGHVEINPRDCSGCGYLVLLPLLLGRLVLGWLVRLGVWLADAYAVTAQGTIA